MTLREKRPFLFGHSLHPNSFEVPTHCLGREGLVADVIEGSGDFYSCLCPLRCDEVDSMADIDRFELAGAASSGLWEVGTVLRANSRHSAMTNSSCNSDFGDG
jgi:hypothetical protein